MGLFNNTGTTTDWNKALMPSYYDELIAAKMPSAVLSILLKSLSWTPF